MISLEPPTQHKYVFIPSHHSHGPHMETICSSLISGLALLSCCPQQPCPVSGHACMPPGRVPCLPASRPCPVSGHACMPPGRVPCQDVPACPQAVSRVRMLMSVSLSHATLGSCSGPPTTANYITQLLAAPTLCDI